MVFIQPFIEIAYLCNDFMHYMCHYLIEYNN